MSAKDADGSDFDPQEFLDRLEESGTRERAIEAKRADAHVMGTTLKLHSQLIASLLTVRRLEAFRDWSPQPNDDGRPPSPYAIYPEPSSPAALDLQWGDTLTSAFGQNPVRENLDMVEKLVVSAVDHLEAIGHLMAETNLSRAPISAARSAMEAAAVASHMIEPTISDLDRLTRGLNVRLGELGEHRLGTGSDDTNPNGGIWQEEIDAIFVGAAALGLTGKYQKPDRWRLPYLGAHKASAQSMMKEILEGDLGESVWRQMSAVAHSRGASPLIIIDALDPHSGNERRRAKVVASNCMPALLVVQHLLPRLADYIGWDLSNVLHEEDGTLLGLWASGSGYYDDEIRSALFGDED